LNEIPPIGWNPQVPDGFWNNTDGINPDASSNVFINNCFAHCGDDCITIKITNSQKGEQKDVRNIRVTNSMFISSTGVLKAGSESLGATISGVYFKNIDILNMRSGYPLKITPRDKSYLSDIVFENVWCEQEKGLFLECRIMEPRSKEQTWHPIIENIYLKDIHLLNDKVNVLIKGYDDNHIVKNIHFNEIFINNRQIKSFPKGWIIKIDFVSNITLNKN
jgi:polygalacturonase